MSIEEYIRKVLGGLTKASDQESAEGEWLDVDFDIGVEADDVNGIVVVRSDSLSRITFRLRVKRS